MASSLFWHSATIIKKKLWFQNFTILKIIIFGPLFLNCNGYQVPRLTNGLYIEFLFVVNLKKDILSNMCKFNYFNELF